MTSPAVIVRRAWRRLPQPIRNCVRLVPGVSAAGRNVRRSVEAHADHQTIYDAAYYANRDASSSAAAIARSVHETFAPQRVLDVGCGTGDLLEHLRALGVDGVGLELSDAALAVCREKGLTVHRFDLEHDEPPAMPAIDVVVSTEVAEHLPEPVADRYVDLLASTADVLVFTAATPGQGGTDHVNEQPHDYWIERLAARGLELDIARTDQFRAAWRDAGAEPWYHENAMVFRRRG